MSRLLELENLTLDWAHTRGILTNGKATTQALKLVSEHGELIGNMVDMLDIKDDIGDCLVVLTNIAALTGSIKITDCKVEFTTKPSSKILGNLCDNVIKNRDISKDISELFNALNQIATAYCITLEECWEVAYNDIKDRVGFLNEHGNFVKSTDQNYAQLRMKFEEQQNG